jgi:hypothetical protein
MENPFFFGVARSGSGKIEPEKNTRIGKPKFSCTEK